MPRSDPRRLAFPTSAEFDQQSYAVEKDYRALKWNVVGSLRAQDQQGGWQTASYSCVGLWTDGDRWFADSKASGTSS